MEIVYVDYNRYMYYWRGTCRLIRSFGGRHFKMHCCILKTEPNANKDVEEQTLSDYLKLAISEFNPVFTNEFLQNLIKTDHDTYLVTTSNGREIACKYVVFTELENKI